MRLDRWLVLPSMACSGLQDPAPPRDHELNAGERARPLAALRGRAPRRGRVSEDLGTQGRRKEGRGRYYFAPLGEWTPRDGGVKLPFQARTPAWNQETKQGKGQEANQGKAVRPYPAPPAAPFSESLFLCQSMGIPENISLSGRIRREPKEEEQDDIWMNSGQFTTDEVKPLRNVSLPAPGRVWGGSKECREWGALAKLEPRNGQQLSGTH